MLGIPVTWAQKKVTAWLDVLEKTWGKDPLNLNIDTKHDGLENVSPSNMGILGVTFQGVGL